MQSKKLTLRLRRHNRVRSIIHGTASRPRLCVYRSNRFVYAQLVDDDQKNTIVSSDDHSIKKTSHKDYKGKIAKAYEVGQELGKQALAKGVEKVVFDRNGYKYHGRVKALAEGARAAGLKF